MTAAALVVLSDITILEEKTKVGARRIRLFERFGLWGTMPMLHLSYSKIDRWDQKAVLQKRYDPEDKSEAADLCKRRQASIRKNVLQTNFMWGGGWWFGGLTWWSFRKYDYKARFIALPFIFYIGTFVGRAVGDIATGRNAEYGRDKFLGQLPGKVYYPLANSD